MAKFTIDNRPWAPHPIPRWIIKEFLRRQKDIGLDYSQNYTWGTDGDGEGTWKNYKGPMVPWIRFFSNSSGLSINNPNGKGKDGFVMFQGEGFERSYGITDNKGILGYQANGEPHILDVSKDGNTVSFPNSNVEKISGPRVVQKFLPPPGIISVDAILQKERIRKITVNWRCYGYAQLQYLTPYFLTPKISAFVEFGWNHFNPASLLDLRNLIQLKELFTENAWKLYEENMKKSYGLYDVTMGIISSFDFTTQDGFVYECKTEIQSKHSNYSGVQINSSAKVCSQKETTFVQSNFANYLEKRLTKLPNCIVSKLNFMKPLDEEEKKNAAFKIIEGFYNNKPEDRFFVGRKAEYGEIDKQLISGKASYDWDNSDQKDVWVTFGFLTELSNLFFTQEIDIDVKPDLPFKLYKIKNDNVIIGGHPNLISTDGSILLIPNSRAPKFNAGNVYPTTDAEDNDYQKQTVNPEKDKSIYLDSVEKISTYNNLPPYNRTVAKVLKPGISARFKTKQEIGILGVIGIPVGDLKLGPFTQTVETGEEVGTGGAVIRDNLDGIINRFRYRTIKSGTFSFPQWDVEQKEKTNGFWGYIEDLYINKDVIVECAKNSDTVESFYNNLLNKISNAAGKFWDLAVVEDESGDGYLKIIDKKYIGDKVNLYQFNIGSSDNFIKSINFTSQLSNVAANQVIAGSSNNKDSKESPKGVVNTNQPLLYPFGDRFNKLTSEMQCIKKTTEQSGLVDNNFEVIRQLQNGPQNSSNTKGSYIMSFKIFDGGTITYVGGNMGGLGPVTPRPVETPGKEVGWNIVNLVLPNESLLLSLLNDLDYQNNTNIYGGQQPGFTVEITLQGISGLRTFQIFSLKNLPSPYSEYEIMCQIIDVSHKIDASNWTTTIKAGIRSIRGRKNVSITFDGDKYEPIKTIE